MYNTVAQTSESTVVAEYRPIRSKSSAYQSEADLEREFIKQLQAQGYEYLKIKSDADLVANLRKKLEELNQYKFSDDEWERFYKQELANANQGIEEKTGTKVPNLYKYLGKYWRYGKVPDALLPDYSPCGKTRDPYKDSAGRPGRPKIPGAAGKKLSAKDLRNFRAAFPLSLSENIYEQVFCCFIIIKIITCNKFYAHLINIFSIK